MKRLFLLLQLLPLVTVYSQSVNIIPLPQSVKVSEKTFTINPKTVIVTAGSDLESIATFLNDFLQVNYGFSLKVQSAAAKNNSIVLNFDRLDGKIAGAYHLNVTANGVYIGGDNKEGVFYGIQSLLQLLPSQKSDALKIMQVSIQDEPRFAYRGLMLDCARHFLPLSFVKKYIDYLAMFKMNRFHWHLTDDQGWRIEIKKYPKLTEVGAWRDGTIVGHHPGKENDNIRSGGFYTQDEIKQVVQYAAERFITVIPEIEMPGHASAAIASYPFLSCFPDEKTKTDFPASAKAVEKQAAGINKIVPETWGVYSDVFKPADETFFFLEDVLDEVITLFPSEYIHIGGDECPKDFWKKSEFCQKLISEKGLKDEHGLQSYFVQRIEKYLNSKGKKIIGWDEILEGGLAPNATVMSWRGEKGGIEAASQNHDVVMTPTTYVYFDYAEVKNDDSLTIGGFLPLDKVYSYNPASSLFTEAAAKHVLGAQANIWTEYIATPLKLEYMLFPRTAALSEVLWTSNDKKNYSDFTGRLPALKKRLDFLKINYNYKTLK
jgi:hexosaminidase